MIKRNIFLKDITYLNSLFRNNWREIYKKKENRCRYYKRRRNKIK